MGFLGIRPGREAGQHVDLAQQAAHHLFAVLLGAEVIEVREDPSERSLDIEDDAFRVVLPLLLKAALVLEKFFAVEIREAGCWNARAYWPFIGPE